MTAYAVTAPNGRVYRVKAGSAPGAVAAVYPGADAEQRWAWTEGPRSTTVHTPRGDYRVTEQPKAKP